MMEPVTRSWTLALVLALGPGVASARETPAELPTAAPALDAPAANPTTAWTRPLEYGAGLGVGLAAGIGGFLVGLAIHDMCCRNDHGAFILHTTLPPLVIGHGLGTAWGVHLVGQHYDPSSGFAVALIGSALGTGLVVALSTFALGQPALGITGPLLTMLSLLVAPVLATLVYELGRVTGHDRDHDILVTSPR